MSYIKVRLGDLVRHNTLDFGIGLVVGYDRTFLTIQWLQHPNQYLCSYSPRSIHTVKIAKDQDEV